MKKITALLLLALVFLLAACGKDPLPAITTTAQPTEITQETWQTLPPTEPFEDITSYRVSSPMEYPDYTFDHTPGTLELRLTAVRAMSDLLSIPWSTAEGIYYYKTGPVSQKFFQHQPDTTYCGVPYSNASAGLFQFLEYYNSETGRLLFPGDGDDIKKVLGSSCADCLIWGWNTVCTSITGPYYPSKMLQLYGYIPVGDYTYDATVDSFNKLPTYTIIEDTDKAIIIDAYTKVLPADAFVSTSDNHGMMVIDIPVVIYNDDGTVNTAESYVLIQDQRGGRGQGFYEQTIDGETLLFSGRTEAKFTFDQLYEKHFLPVTTAEFAGLKPYEAPTVTISRDSWESLSQLLDTTIESNYPLAVVNAWIADKDGNRQLLGRKTFGGASDQGVPRSYQLSQMDCLKDFSSSRFNVPSYMIQIEVVTSTGVRFTPVVYTI